jgi:hypothetical protein
VIGALRSTRNGLKRFENRFPKFRPENLAARTFGDGLAAVNVCTRFRFRENGVENKDLCAVNENGREQSCTVTGLDEISTFGHFFPTKMTYSNKLKRQFQSFLINTLGKKSTQPGQKNYETSFFLQRSWHMCLSFLSLSD